MSSRLIDLNNFSLGYPKNLTTPLKVNIYNFINHLLAEISPNSDWLDRRAETTRFRRALEPCDDFIFKPTSRPRYSEAKRYVSNLYGRAFTRSTLDRYMGICVFTDFDEFSKLPGLHCVVINRKKPRPDYVAQDKKGHYHFVEAKGISDKYKVKVLRGFVAQSRNARLMENGKTVTSKSWVGAVVLSYGNLQPFCSLVDPTNEGQIDRPEEDRFSLLRSHYARVAHNLLHPALREFLVEDGFNFVEEDRRYFLTGSLVRSGKTRTFVLLPIGQSYFERDFLYERFGFGEQYRAGLAYGLSTDLAQALSNAALAGARFNYPYQCKVGERDARQNLDREFHVFLLFLPRYCTLVNKQFLLAEKFESPNFIITDDKGNAIGIEITEAPLNDTHSFEQKERDRFFNNLRTLLHHLPCHVSLWARPDPSWTRLNRQFGAISSSLVSEIGKALAETPKESDQSAKVRVDGLVFSVNHNETFELGFDMSEPEYTGDFPEQLFSTAISTAIQNKLDRKKPEMQPCILAVYPNTGLVQIKYEKVLQMIRAAIPCENTVTHFSEVYISSDQRCARICPI